MPCPGHGSVPPRAAACCTTCVPGAAPAVCAAATPPEASSPASGSAASAIIFCLVFIACLLTSPSVHGASVQHLSQTYAEHAEIAQPRFPQAGLPGPGWPAGPAAGGSSAAVDGTIGPG